MNKLFDFDHVWVKFLLLWIFFDQSFSLLVNSEVGFSLSYCNNFSSWHKCLIFGILLIIIFSKPSLANLEDEIFLKGGSVVTPQKFNHFFYLKLCQELKIFFLDFLVISEPLLLPEFQKFFCFVWNFWVLLYGLST